MKHTGLLIVNTLTLIFALIMNYLYGTGTSGGATVSEISARYETLFTPASFAFAIWGLIYVLLLAFVGYQWFDWLKNKNAHYIQQTGFWLALGNIANGLWIFTWINENIGLSLLLIVVLLISLMVLMVKLRLEIWDAPVRIIAFVWWPICIYLGWIIVATMANFAAFLVSLNPNSAIATRPFWTIIMIGVACVIYLLLIIFRNMREAAAVGMWAFAAIAVKQWQTNDEIVYAAVIAVAILIFASIIQVIKNMETLPFKKMKRGEI